MHCHSLKNITGKYCKNYPFDHLLRLSRENNLLKSNLEYEMKIEGPFFLTPAIQTVSHKPMLADTVTSNTMSVAIAVLTLLCVK